MRSDGVRGIGALLLVLGAIGLAAVPMYVFVHNPGFREDVWLLMLLPAFFMALLGGALALRYARAASPDTDDRPSDGDLED